MLTSFADNAHKLQGGGFGGFLEPLDFDPRAEPARAAERLLRLEQAAQHLNETSGNGSNALDPKAYKGKRT